MSRHACVDKMAEPKSRDRSSSTESQLKFLGCTHYRRRNDNHYRCQQCRLNEGLTLCTEDSPCEVCKDWLPEAWQAQEKANEQKRRRKAAAKAAKISQERDMMDDSVEIHAPEEALQLPTTKHKSDGLSQTKRPKTATGSGSGSKATEVEQSAGRPSRSREPKKSVSSSVLVVGRPRSDRSSGPRGRNATGHVVVNASIDLTGPTDARTLQGPIILLDTTVDVERGVGPAHVIGWVQLQEAG